MIIYNLQIFADFEHFANTMHSCIFIELICKVFINHLTSKWNLLSNIKQCLATLNSSIKIMCNDVFVSSQVLLFVHSTFYQLFRFPLKSRNWSINFNPLKNTHGCPLHFFLLNILVNIFFLVRNESIIFSSTLKKEMACINKK